MSDPQVVPVPAAPVTVVGVGVGGQSAVGGVPALPGPPGPDRLFVGPTPPLNPQLYDVWVDTSEA